MITLAVTNLINLMLFLATLMIALLTFYFLRREQWITLYFEFTKRFAEIRWKLPKDILSDSFEVSRLNEEGWKYMRQYFVLCSEEFYLKEKKKWIGKKLWKEWEL